MKLVYAFMRSEYCLDNLNKNHVVQLSWNWEQVSWAIAIDLYISWMSFIFSNQSLIFGTETDFQYSWMRDLAALSMCLVSEHLYFCSRMEFICNRQYSGVKRSFVSVIWIISYLMRVQYGMRRGQFHHMWSIVPSDCPHFQHPSEACGNQHLSLSGVAYHCRYHTLL